MPIPTADGGLYFASGIDNSGLIRGKRQAVGIIKGLGSQIGRLDVFAGLTAAGIAAFTKITKASWALAKDFDMAMREVQTISGAAQDNFEGMKDSVIALSRGVPDSAQKLSKALYQIVSAGYDGAEGLELLEVASKAAVSGVTDTLTAADGLTTVMNAWKISAENSTGVADVFFKTVEKGKTTFGELASNIAQVAPLASAYGVSFEQIAAATATLTKQGTSTSMAMTQLRQGLIAVNEELGAGWSKTYTLQEAFGELSKRAEESGKDIKEFTGRVEGAMAILGMTGKNAEMAASDLESVSKAAGASGKAFDTMSQAAENNIRIMKNRWHAKLLGYGESLIRMFGRVATALNSRAVVKGLQEEAREARLAVLDITALGEGTDKRKEAIERLKMSYPAYFKNLDSEKTKNEDLLDVLKLMNEEYGKKIILQEYADQLGKVAREEEKLEKTRLRNIQQLDTRARMLGFEGLKYDELLKKMKEITEMSRKEQVALGLEPMDVAFITRAVKFLEGYNDELGKIGEKKSGIEEAKKRLEELLKLGDKKVKAEIEVEVTKGGGEFKWEFTEDELAAFKEQIKEVKTAYDEWNKYKKTSLAGELKDEYDLYLEHGKDYEDYLEYMLRAYKGNAEARTLIMKELAELEAKYIEATEKIMHEFYESMAKDAGESFNETYKKAQQSFEKFTDALEKSVQVSLTNEKAPDEAAKAYVRFGKILFLTNEQLDDLNRTTQGYINTLGMLGSAISDFGGEGNEALRSIGEGIMGIANILSGNYFMGALQLLKAMKDYQQFLFEKDEQDNRKAIENSIERMNRLLDEQYIILSKLAGLPWFQQANVILEEYRKEAEEIEKTLQGMKIRYETPGYTFWEEFKLGGLPKFSVTIFRDKDVDEIQKIIDSTESLDDTERKYIQGLIDKYKWLIGETENLTNDIRQNLVGMEADSMIGIIVDAFEEGKLAVQDFADTFEKVMKRAMIHTFKQQFLAEQMQTFYNALYSSLQQTAPTIATGTGIISTGQLGEITDEEMAELQRIWEQINTSAAEGWKAMEDLWSQWFDDMSGADDPNSLVGAIRRELTEETGSLLAGKMNMLILDVRQMTIVQSEMADYLNAIRLNTSYNRFLQNLGEIRNDIHALRSELTA